MENESTDSSRVPTLANLYHNLPPDFADLTFKYMTAAPQNEIDQRDKSAMESIEDCSNKTTNNTDSCRVPTLANFYNDLPPDFVDLTFKYMTAAPQNKVDQKDKSAMEPIIDSSDKPTNKAKLAKPATADLASHLQGSRSDHDHSHGVEAEAKSEGLARSMGSGKAFKVAERGDKTMRSPFEVKTEQRPRKGNPHSNICALCDSYIHIFKHRCLVCGRVYCKNCVRKGMGEMTEGRKCLECLGRKFSQRYINMAGTCGCCFGYPSDVKRQELIWAEKGASNRTEEKNKKNGSVMKEKCEKSEFVWSPNNPVLVATPRRTPSGEKPAFIITSTVAFNSSHGISFQEM